MTEPAMWRRTAVAAVLHDAGAESLQQCLDSVHGVLDQRAIDALQHGFGDVRPAAGARVDDHMPHGPRRRVGAFFTPPAVAARIAELVSTGEGGRVLDLSCGDGVLLEACVGAAELVGVEEELTFALAAAVRLRGVAASVRVLWGDGLQLRDELRGARAVVGNPPYVGEKGNRQLFATVRAAHPDLADCFGPRIDLHYLFIHRALDYLAPGGRLAYLTSEYWLTATGADRLRADLARRTTERAFERLGAGTFDSAPGHHSLIFSAIRRRRDATPTSKTWHPFARTARADGVPLGDVAQDRQGFVSGADRVTARIARVCDGEPGTPIYLWHRDEVPQEAEDLFRPLVRRAECVPNSVLISPPGEHFVLWCDGSEDEDTLRRLEALLRPFRGALEARREVRTGAMRWTRIWWPRNTAEYGRPKLVVPRRAVEPRFCLDLSGSHVSSDCTFLLAPDGIEDEVGWLTRVMIAANSDVAAEQIRSFGKTKGRVIEFYSAPLRDWRLPLQRRGERLIVADEALEAAAVRLLEQIDRPRERGLQEPC